MLLFIWVSCTAVLPCSVKCTEAHPIFMVECVCAVPHAHRPKWALHRIASRAVCTSPALQKTILEFEHGIAWGRVAGDCLPQMKPQLLCCVDMVPCSRTNVRGFADKIPQGLKITDFQKWCSSTAMTPMNIP